MSTWLSAITALRDSRAEKPPPGFKTRAEIQQELGIRTAHAGRILCAAVASGMAECRNFTITTGQVTRPVPHYRLRKIAKESSQETRKTRKASFKKAHK